MSTTTQTRSYVIDPAHSSANFSVRHLMIAKVRGTFRTLSGSVEVADGGTEPTAVSIDIDVASIDTREEQRDAHLRSADFFDTEHFANMTFVSTAVRSSSATTFDVTGDLTIRGVTKSITVPVEASGPTRDLYGKERIAYEASFSISRKDYGITWSMALETGGVAVSDEVQIQLDLQVVPKDA